MEMTTIQTVLQARVACIKSVRSTCARTKLNLPRAAVREGPLMASDNTSGRGMEQSPARKPFAQFLQNEHGYPERNDETPNRFSRSEEHTSELQSLRHLVCRL